MYKEIEYMAAPTLAILSGFFGFLYFATRVTAGRKIDANKWTLRALAALACISTIAAAVYTVLLLTGD